MSNLSMESLAAALNPLPTQALFYTEGCTSHLDLGSNDGRTLRGLDRSQITCVELFGPSVEVLRGNGFAHVYQADIRTVVAGFAQEQRERQQAAERGEVNLPPAPVFDRVTSFDVIEHIPKPDGERLIEQIEQIAGREIVLFMPVETPELEATEKWQRFREQGLSLHPDAQRQLHAHQSRWSPQELADRGYITLFLPNFHYEGFGAFFAAKYRDPADQAAVLERVQAWATAQEGPRIDRPLLVGGREHMDIHPSVVIGFGARLECIESYGGQTYSPHLEIGEGTTAEQFLHVGCAESVRIGKDCMIAGHVSITDHDHGFDPERPLHGQQLTVAPVVIDDGVFLGEYTFVGKGVTIGDHAVVGAHAVVVKDVPPYAVVGGVPARVIAQGWPRAGWQAYVQRRPVSCAQPLVSIVVPTLWAAPGVEDNLWAVRRHTPEPHEVILVNNGSQNWSLAQWGYRESVTVIWNQENLGFARACNQGIAAAKGEYVLLLNDDVQVTPGWLTRMLRVMHDHPEVGLVGPVSDRVSGPQCGQPGGTGVPPTPCLRLVGFCLLIRRSVIERIGGLDESFGLNFEDDDFCVRAWLAGFGAMIAWDAFVYHAAGATIKALGIDYAQSLEHAWEIFRAKWGAERTEGGYRLPSLPAFDPAKHYVALPGVE